MDEVNNMNENIENEEQDDNVNAQAVSKDSNEYDDNIKNEIKRAKNKGMLQGFILTMICVLIVCVLYMGIRVIKMIGDGSIYANVMGTHGSIVLDKPTIEKINKIYRLVENTYIENADKEAVRDGMYKGMMEALDDPYSVYYTKEEFEEMMESSSGEFEGIGAYLQQDPDTMVITVSRPIKHSPAEEVGILSGDRIVEVDGEDITGQDLNLVVSKVRGPKGTHVNIGVVREGEKDIITFEIERATVHSESVESEMYDNNIGYIFITAFEDETDEQFIEAYEELKEKGMKSLILDLRTNGGGYVDTSVAIADRLVKEGDIVSIKDRNGKGITYSDEGDENYIDIPCVLLVDGNTASASEILTGALKDYGLATVMGTQTFGKGIVQDVIPLGDGSGVKITNSKYYTPNGENIHGVGIEPDIIVGWDYDMYKSERVDNQLEAAKQYLEKGKIDDKYIPDMETEE